MGLELFGLFFVLIAGFIGCIFIFIFGTIVYRVVAGSSPRYTRMGNIGKRGFQNQDVFAQNQQLHLQNQQLIHSTGSTVYPGDPNYIQSPPVMYPGDPNYVQSSGMSDIAAIAGAAVAAEVISDLAAGADAGQFNGSGFDQGYMDMGNSFDSGTSFDSGSAFDSGSPFDSSGGS